MIKRQPWIFQLPQDYRWDASEFIDKCLTFDNAWLNLKKGVITVKRGYTWDGCSYKWSIADLWVIGVPDGRLEQGLPITYYASLIHDALTQFRRDLPITHQQATAIFDAMLKQQGFIWRPFYVWMVSKFGPRDFLGNCQMGVQR